MQLPFLAYGFQLAVEPGQAVHYRDGDGQIDHRIDGHEGFAAANSQQQAALLAKALEKELGYPPVETVHIGACISINIGPDVIAVCYKHQ